MEFAPPQTPKGQKPVCLGVRAAWGNIVLAQRRHPIPLLAPTPQFSSPLHAFAAAHFLTGHWPGLRAAAGNGASPLVGSFASSASTAVDALTGELLQAARPEAERLGVRPSPLSPAPSPRLVESADERLTPPGASPRCP